MMKKPTVSCLCLSMVLVSFGCQKWELEPKEFIKLRQDQPVLLSINSVRLSATIDDWVAAQISDHGFVWTPGDNIPAYAYSPPERIISKNVKEKASGNNFTSVLENLQPYTTYTIVAFTVVEGEIFESPPQSFSTGNGMVFTDGFSYQGGFSIELTGHLDGTETGIVATRHGFCWSKESAGPPRLGGNNFIDLGTQRNNDPFTATPTIFRPEDDNTAFLLGAFAVFDFNQRLDTVYGDPVRFDGNINYWLRVADIEGGSRHAAVGFSMGNKGYVGTGKNLMGATTPDFFEFDPTTGRVLDGKVLGEWKKLEPSEDTLDREEAIGFAIEIEPGVWRGYVGTGYKSDFWELNPSTGTWRRMTDMPGGNRVYASAFVIGKKAYVGLGANSNDFYEFDPSAGPIDPVHNKPMGAWRLLSSPAGGGRSKAAGFAIGPKGYLLDGAELLLFDPSADPMGKWEIKAMPALWDGRPYAVAFVIGNTAYVGTGGSQRALQDIWAFDASNGNWSRVADFPQVVTSAVAFTISGKGYVGSGFTDEGYKALNTAAFWEFNP